MQRCHSRSDCQLFPLQPSPAKRRPRRICRSRQAVSVIVRQLSGASGHPRVKHNGGLYSVNTITHMLRAPATVLLPLLLLLCPATIVSSRSLLQTDSTADAGRPLCQQSGYCSAGKLGPAFYGDIVNCECTEGGTGASGVVQLKIS